MPAATTGRPPSPPLPRLLVVPGLHDSGPAHWQTWLHSLHRDARRVVQPDWETPDLERWADAVAGTLDEAGDGPWIVAAHSFGCLATLRHLVRQPETPVAGLLLVAPADPDKFGVGARLPLPAVDAPVTFVYSETDPWLAPDAARRWAARWGAVSRSLGDAGHINAEAGFGPLPLAQRWVVRTRQRWQRDRRASAGRESVSASSLSA